MECDFVLAIVKGLVERDEGSTYFGSLMGYGTYVDQGIERGLLIRGPKVCYDNGHPFTVHTARRTDAGREAYKTFHLDRLPTKGRAYAWDWGVCVDNPPVKKTRGGPRRK